MTELREGVAVEVWTELQPGETPAVGDKIAPAMRYSSGSVLPDHTSDTWLPIFAVWTNPYAFGTGAHDYWHNGSPVMCACRESQVGLGNSVRSDNTPLGAGYRWQGRGTAPLADGAMYDRPVIRKRLVMPEWSNLLPGEVPRVGDRVSLTAFRNALPNEADWLAITNVEPSRRNGATHNLYTPGEGPWYWNAFTLIRPDIPDRYHPDFPDHYHWQRTVQRLRLPGNAAPVSTRATFTYDGQTFLVPVVGDHILVTSEPIDTGWNHEDGDEEQVYLQTGDRHRISSVSRNHSENRYYISVEFNVRIWDHDEEQANDETHEVALIYPNPSFVVDDPSVKIERPVKWNNLVMLVPRDADRTVLQLAPTPRLAAFIPAKEREATIRYFTTAKVKLPMVRSAWVADLVGGGSGIAAKPTLFVAPDVSTEKPDSNLIWMTQWRGANVHPDGRVCWGNHNTEPKSLRAAHTTYWSAPFNADLSDRSSVRSHERTCADLNPPHECGTYKAGARCAVKHACKDGQHVRPHVHKCAGSLPNSGVEKCKRIHSYNLSAWSMSLSTQRAYIKTRALHIDTPERLAKFRVTLEKTFGDATKCPCHHCVNQCGCYTACSCCAGTCSCLECPCAVGICACRRGCNCCDGYCRCRDMRRECSHDRAAMFGVWLRDEYKPDAPRDRTKYIRGDRYIEMTGKTDGIFLTSKPKLVESVPETHRAADGGGEICIAGFAIRKPDGTFDLTIYPNDKHKDAAPVKVTVSREELTVCV